MGQRLKGVVHLVTGEVHLYEQGRNFTRQDSTIFASLDDPALEARIGAPMLRRTARRTGTGAGRLASVRSGRVPGRQADAGVLRLGGQQLRRAAAARLLRRARAAAASRARPPRAKSARTSRTLSGFVFKIQANMDPQHRDRVAFMRICSGKFDAGMKALHVAHRQGSEARQRADLHGQRPRDRRDRLSGRRDRHPQPRHDLDRRQLHRRRDAVVHRHPELRAGTVPPRAPARSAQAQAAAEGPGAAVARKARPSSSAR